MGKENLHFFPVLLDVPEIIDDDHIETGQLLEHLGKFKISLGYQQFLDQDAARCIENTPVLVHKIKTQGAQEMSLSTPGIPKGQDVFSPVYEGSTLESFDLMLKFMRQSFEFEGIEVFSKGGSVKFSV